MSKSPKRKKLGVKALLELMGADPNELAPMNLAEARALSGLDQGTKEELPRCPANGKVMFSSEGTAKAAARSRLNKGSNVNKLRHYRCPDCNAFHLSSSFHR